MKKSREKRPPLSKGVQEQIIVRWRFSKLNSIPQLAKEFNCPETQIHSCINSYLNKKTI
jgi:hypothetical protein